MATTHYSKALLAAIRAGELIDEDKFGLLPTNRSHRPLTLTKAMRADTATDAAMPRGGVLLRRGQFTPTAPTPDERL